MKSNIHEQARAPDMPQINGLAKPTSQKTRAPARAVVPAWLILVGLLVLGAIPLIAGAFRLVELAGGADVTPANARFFGSPLPVVLHIVAAAAFIVLGAFQFVPGFRRRRPGWHRRVGRLLVGSGLVAALSGLWMTQFYQLPDHDGALLYGFRLLFGSLMAISIVLSFVAIRRREIARHRAWMMRGYALGLGAGTQVLTLGIGEVVFGPPGEFSRALLMGGGWVINLAVAEWVIRKPPASAASRASAHLSHLDLRSA
jgi:uncharacterized membrane protein